MIRTIVLEIEFEIDLTDETDEEIMAELKPVSDMVTDQLKAAVNDPEIDIRGRLYLRPLAVPEASVVELIPHDAIPKPTASRKKT